MTLVVLFVLASLLTASAQTNPCAILSLGKNANTNGFLSQSIPEFNQEISQWSVDAAKTAAYQKEYCNGGCDHMHLDNSVPYSIIDGSTPGVSVRFEDTDDSDAVKYPLSTTTPIEGGLIGPVNQQGKLISSDGDHHALVIDRKSCKDYEVYQAGLKNGMWTGYAGVSWDMTKTVRRHGKNSADLAGLPIWPLLIKYNEAASGQIHHAFRITCNNTNGHPIPPATHASGSGSDACYPGMRLRLKVSVDISNYPPTIRTVMQAMKSYGLFVADNGSNMYVTADDDSRWNPDEFRRLGDLNETMFEVVTPPRK